MRATVVIPTLNGGSRFEAVLEACVARAADGSIDVLVIDSGSTDGSADRARGRPVRLHEIPNREFGHGRTRNLAAELSDADVLVYLTQDAVPQGRDWLDRLVGPLERDAQIGATFARQVPEPQCRPTVKRDVTDFFRSLGPDRGVHVQSGPAPFLSNVASAVRRDVLQRIPFRDIPYAEDRALATDLATAGFLVAYTPEAVVEHSHDLRLRPYFKRMLDEFGALRDLGLLERRGLLRHVGALLVGTARDAWMALTDTDLRVPMRLRYACGAIGYNAARRLAIALAAGDRAVGPGSARSLEADRRRAAAGGEP